MRKIGRFVAIILAVAVAGVAVVMPLPAASAATPPPALPAPPHPVFIFGDSVVAGAKSAILARLPRDHWAPQVFAIPGVSIAQVAAAVISAHSMPDVVVIGLGYSYFWKPFVLRKQVDALLYALSKRNVRRVIWLNVREDRPERRDVNLELNAATTRWGNLEVVDWNRLSVSRSNVFESDGHHLLPFGGQLMAAFMQQRLDAFRARVPIAPPPVYGRRNDGRLNAQAFGTDDLGAIAAANEASRVLSPDPFVGIATNPTGHGYWLAQRHGMVVHEGNANAWGNAAGLPLHAPIVGIAATPSGRGYWLVASDGGVFSFGDAHFYGSTGAIRLNAPIVGMQATANGHGYWLVASDGGVFSYGNARFYGSTGAIALSQPIVAMAPQPNNRGYWLIAYDGGVFSFGHAPYKGSGASTPRYWPIVDGLSAPDGNGYWLLTADGQVLNYGSAKDLGSVTSTVVQSLDLAPIPGGYIDLRVGEA